MPIIKSAKKALRVSEQNKAFNDITRSKIKSAVKGVRIAVSKKEGDLKELLARAYRELDLAAKKNVIHKNKASRLKSRLTLAASKAQTTEAPKAKKTSKK